MQARVSDDYQPGNDQWKIGISSIFSHALGIAPFKDDFRTTTNQTGDPYGNAGLIFSLIIIFTIFFSANYHKYPAILNSWYILTYLQHLFQQTTNIVVISS